MPERFKPNEENEENEEVESGPTSLDVGGLDDEELDSLITLDKPDAIDLVVTAGSTFQTLLRLKEEIEEGIAEAEKFDGGVNAPGTRIRKHLLYVQKVSQVLRSAISATRANR